MVDIKNALLARIRRGRSARLVRPDSTFPLWPEPSALSSRDRLREGCEEISSARRGVRGRRAASCGGCWDCAPCRSPVRSSVVRWWQPHWWSSLLGESVCLQRRGSFLYHSYATVERMFILQGFRRPEASNQFLRNSQRTAFRNERRDFHRRESISIMPDLKGSIRGQECHRRGPSWKFSRWLRGKGVRSPAIAPVRCGLLGGAR